MRKKIIGILICIMLLITSALTTLISPEKNNVVASPEEESEEEMGLDMDYIWIKLGNISNVTYEAYYPTDIPKGRSFGSKGGNFTVEKILKREMRNTSNLTNVTTERLQTIDALHNNYSSIINISDFSFMVNAIGTQSYLYENPIPKKEMFPIAYKFHTKNKNEWTQNYTFSNAEIRPINMTKILPIWGEFEEFIEILDFEFLNTDYSPLLGNVTYIPENGSVPSPDGQYTRVFLLDDVSGVQEKLENITNASGVIIIKTGNPRIADASDCPFPVVLVYSEGGNAVKELIDDYTVVVDNIRSLTRKLTFTYDPDESSRQPYFVIDRIPDYNEFLRLTEIKNIFKNFFYNFLLWIPDSVLPLYPGFQTYLTCLQMKTSFLLNICRQCKGVILYDSHNYHFMWSMNTQSTDPWTSVWFDLPTICVNKSVGEFLRNHCEDFTLSGYINQEYLEEKQDAPGAIGDNIYGNITIDKSPSDMIAIVSNRYDGMFGQTSGDSAVGTAIVLGIAKYFNDHRSVKPKYNITFLFTTAEEYGFHGARYYCDKHIGQKQKVKYWLSLEQQGFNQDGCKLCIDYRDTSDNSSFDKILDEIRKDSGYPEENTIKRTGESISDGSEQATIDAIFNNTTTFCLGKDQDRRWDQWHRAGSNYLEGDSMKNIVRDEVNASARLTLGFVKYFMVNPDCWFNAPAIYTAEDSPYDSDDVDDSINVTVSVTSTLPNDKVRVNATVKSWPSNTTVFWKNFDFNVTSEGTQQTLIVTVPPASTGATNGTYYLTLGLLNSTGRINDVALNMRVYNDTDTQTGHVYLSPRSNTIINKPNNITGPSVVKIHNSANFTTSAVDMNQDQLQYQWDWYVPFEITTTVGPIDSGENCTTNYTFDSWGNRTIQVRARDDYRYLFDGPEGWNRYSDWSDWSEPFEIDVRYLTGFSMSCTALSTAVNAQSAAELPSIQQINSTYDAVVFGGTEPYTYSWTFNHELYAWRQKTVNYSFEETGIHSVVLTVTDNDGNSEEFSVNVSVVNLSASFNLSIPSPFAEIDENITFTDTSAVAVGYNMTNWIWDFDDGTISYSRNTTHVFTKEGLYNVSLTVRDNRSHTDVSNQQILVFLDDTPPEIRQVNDDFHLKDRWLEVMIAGSFNDTESGINHTAVNITYPDGAHLNHTMNHFVNDTYWFIFNDTAQVGQYNYTVWVTDYENNTSNATGYSFTIPTPPFLLYATTTPDNNTVSNDPWTDVNVTVLDPMNTSGFIDWDNSLKGYWPMESYNNTGVYDNSTYDNFGVFQNGLNNRNIIPGKYGKGLEFDGIDQYVDVGTSDSLDLGTGDFTFMVWEKSHTKLYSKKAMILTNNPRAESWKGYGFGVINSPYLIVSQSSGNNITLQGTVDVTDDAWHHIAYVCRSGHYYIYVDGEEDADTWQIVAKNITNAQSTMIAYDGHASEWCYFDGMLDEPQLYNRALGWEEINASYNNGINRLFHNFTDLPDGTYSFYAHAIDTTGNQSTTETRQILIDITPPTITDVTASPHTVGFGYNVTVTADVIDNGSGIDLVTVQIVPPNGVGNSSNNTMTLISNNAYQYVFTDTWLTGQYNYTIWATDSTNNTASSSGHHFHVSSEVTISIATLQDSYTGNQYINITDPPNLSENYTLVDRGLTWDKYYDATTGQNILDVSTRPINYQEEGTWVPINNTLNQLAENHPAYVYGYRSGNNRGLYGTYFKSNAQLDWPVAFTYNKSNDPTIHAVRSKLVGVGYVDPQSNWAYQYLQNVQNSQGQINDNSVTYPGVFTGTDVTWSYGSTGLKEEITLSNATKTVLQNHPPSQYGLNDASSYLVFITKLDYQSLNLYNGSGVLDGNITISDVGVDFKDVFGQFKCALPLGEAYELNNELIRQKLTYRIIHLNGATYLLSGLRISTLLAMVFPVVIDPTITISSLTCDGYISQSSSVSYNAAWTSTTGTVTDSADSIIVGQTYGLSLPSGYRYIIYRGFLFFNTSELPENAYMDNAIVSLYKKSDASPVDFDIVLQNGQPVYPHNPMQTSDYSKSLYAGDGGSIYTGDFVNGRNNFTLTNLSWINQTGVTKLCLRSSRDINGTAPSGTEYIAVYSRDKTSFIDYTPHLVVTYRNQSKIKNTGSTDIKGYLLIQIQFYNTSQSTWLEDNDAVNETTPRTINSNSQLALDTIFNGLVRASDLTHGTGTYRVYTAFRDPDGNILKTNDDTELKAWWQFSKT